MATQVRTRTDRTMTSTREGKSTIDESSPAGLPRAAAVSFGRETCGSLEQAEQREWHVTNGIGGFAPGTMSGNLTRRYHGLLLAALKIFDGDAPFNPRGCIAQAWTVAEVLRSWRATFGWACAMMVALDNTVTAFRNRIKV
jgi:hypothetical protein